MATEALKMDAVSNWDKLSLSDGITTVLGEWKDNDKRMYMYSQSFILFFTYMKLYEPCDGKRNLGLNANNQT